MNYHFSDKILPLKPSAIREMFKYTENPNILSFGGGNPAPETFPIAEIRRISADILQNRYVEALQYGITEGYRPLRERLRSQLRELHNIGTDSDNVIIISGAQQAMDLVSKVMTNEGDTVLSEDPSFIGALNCFRSYNTNLAGVPMAEDGMDLAALEHAMKTQPNVRLLYMIPTFQNPTGITTSLEKRKKIYELICQYDVILIEDNPYGDLRYAGEEIPTFKSMDEEHRVIYVGSFSKIISPGIRLGYIVAPAEINAKLTVAKQAADVHTNMFFQMVVDQYLEEGNIDANIARACEIYSRKLNLMLDLIDEYFPKEVKTTRPQGGLFLWCDLPAEADGVKFADLALRHELAIVPGQTFMCRTNRPYPGFRLNFSMPSEADIRQGIPVMGQILKAYLADLQ
jgi:2-aminoadipate transaminase